MTLKKIAFFVFIIVSLFIMNGLAHSIFSLWQIQSLVAESNRELAMQESENASLRRQLKVVNNKQFVEEQARDKLFLIKPGEGVIVMPELALQASSSGQPIASDTRPNWEKWWDLFF